MTAHDKPTELGRLLRQRLRQWQAGLAQLALLQALSRAILVLLGYFVLDYFLALGSAARFALGALLLGLLAAVLAARGIRIAALTPRDMAVRADRRIGGRRRAVLGALELETWLAGGAAREAGLMAYLAGQAVGRAADQVRRLDLRDALLEEEFCRHRRVLYACAAAAALVFLVNVPATRTILARIFLPGRDVPPYSRYTFQVEPASPVVLYGGDLAVRVEIGGRTVGGEAGFLTRAGGRIHRAACFQESATRYAQRLEGVIEPVEFCFTVGRARSRWCPVDVLFDPHIAAAEVVLVPPAYSGKPARRFYLGAEDVSGLKGTRVELTLTSNRPLRDGVIHWRFENDNDSAPALSGEKVGDHTVRFTWILRATATAEITVRDIRGTPNASPFKMAQRVVPDEPPSVALSEPPPFSLATPGITVPVRGAADDDLGLRQVDLARALVGYRDRLQTVGPPEPASGFEYEGELALPKLGVEAGQVLELYLEAMDSNPSLAGISVSEVARIQIISEEEYALMLRVRISAEEFAGRFNEVHRDFTNLQEALRALSDELGKSERDADAVERAREEARRAAGRAAKAFDEVARDFPAFDMERRLQEAAAGMADRMRETEALLAGSPPPHDGLQEQVDAFLAEYAAGRRALDEQVRDAGEAALLAEIMESAAHYARLLAEQEALVRRLSRFEGGGRKEDLPILADLESRQADIRRQLTELLDRIDAQAGRLRLDYQQLTADMEAFVEKARELEIVPTMEDAELKARNHDGAETCRLAGRALEKMKELAGPEKGNCFGGMCQGQLRFDVRQNMRSTLEQMLAAITMRICSGEGSMPGMGRGGSGLGGGGDDGYWMGGQSPLDVAVYGPERRAYRSSPAGGSGAGRGKGPGDHRIGKQESDRVAPAASGPVAAESMPLENVPENYRESVKRYFSAEEP
ncbi:MAG TPA: hypothetical protein P5567_10610 [Kiritimatiellia bacterium]|nr:hypothetical protein [Kiritimatiellia bacterium]HRZ12891.1 hypothetical protein [Kiritimatiellia bacterium]HSA18499.1 hypothetical protein [Kiritimatiellia bacterium]